MFGAKDIAKQAKVVATVDAGPIVEISFKGRHWDHCGDQLIDYVGQTVHELKPIGVVLNLSGFKYRGGDDIGALLFPLLDRQTDRFLPFCIVANGRTARSLKSLFALTMLPDIVNARYVDSVGDGLEYLKDHLRGDTV